MNESKRTLFGKPVVIVDSEPHATESTCLGDLEAYIVPVGNISLSQEEADRLKREWAAQYVGTENAERREVVLEADIDWKACIIALTEEDRQFLELRASWADRITRVFRWDR